LVFFYSHVLGSSLGNVYRLALDDFLSARLGRGVLPNTHNSAEAISVESPKTILLDISRIGEREAAATLLHTRWPSVQVIDQSGNLPNTPTCVRPDMAIVDERFSLGSVWRSHLTWQYLAGELLNLRHPVWHWLSVRLGVLAGLAYGLIQASWQWLLVLARHKVESNVVDTIMGKIIR
jgi:hypothetical protein